MLLSNPEAPQVIASLLGARARPAPFQVPALPAGLEGQPASAEPAPVFQIAMRSRELRRPLLILLWPSLSRVDVRLGDSTWTLKGVSEVDLYPGVEVLFRRTDPPAFLFVSVQGRVALVA